MQRRNFLRNAALTLPVALAAPEMLLAGNSSNVKQTGIIIAGSGEGAAKAAALLAADSSNTATAAESVTACSALTKVTCSNNGFTVTDGEGNTYTTTKIIFTGSLSFCGTSARVHVEAGRPTPLTLSIRYSSHRSATCWVAPAGKPEPHLLNAFRKSRKAAFMCLA